MTFFSLSLVDIIDVDSLRRDFFRLPAAQPDASIYTPVACAFDFCFSLLFPTFPAKFIWFSPFGFETAAAWRYCRWSLFFFLFLSSCVCLGRKATRNWYARDGTQHARRVLCAIFFGFFISASQFSRHQLRWYYNNLRGSSCGERRKNKKKKVYFSVVVVVVVCNQTFGHESQVMWSTHFEHETNSPPPPGSNG